MTSTRRSCWPTGSPSSRTASWWPMSPSTCLLKAPHGATGSPSCAVVFALSSASISTWKLTRRAFSGLLPDGWLRSLVPRLVDQLVLGDPGHQSPQAFAHDLDRVLGVQATGGLEARLAHRALRHPVADETPRLDVFQNLGHLLAG